MMIDAVLDACVLYSSSLRDFLLRQAHGGLFYPFWSDEIQDEWTRNLLQNRPDLRREKIERTCREMNAHFPKGLVRGYESIVTTLSLPHLNDRHVLAAAIQAKAKYIVTLNLNDFPNAVLQSHNVEAALPDEFVMLLIQDKPNQVLNVVKYHRQNLARPPKTVNEYLDELEKRGLVKTVAFL